MSGSSLRKSTSSSGSLNQKSQSSLTVSKPGTGKHRIPRPNAVIMKIFGVLGSYHFQQEMIKYGRAHMNEYLKKHMNDKIMPHLITRLKKDAKVDLDAGEKDAPQIPEKGTPVQMMEALCRYANWKLGKGNLHSNSPVNLLNGWVVNEGYISNTFHTHIFKDAATAIHKWRFGADYIKNYTIAAAEKDGQKNYIQSSCEGDLTQCFNNYIPLVTEKRALLKHTYQVITTMIRDEPNFLLFITDIPEQAKAAADAGLMVFVIQRHAEPNLSPPEKLRGFHVIRSFDDIEFIDDPSRPAPCC